MPPSGNGVIGNAVIEVTVDPSKIKAGFAQAGQVAAKETPKVAKQVDAQGGLLGTAAGIKQWSKPIREFRESIQGTATAIFGMTGTIALVVAGVAGAVTAVRELWSFATRANTAFDRTGYSLSNTADQASRLAERLKAISEQNRPGVLAGSDKGKALLSDDEYNKVLIKQKEEANAKLTALEYEQRNIPKRIDALTASTFDATFSTEQKQAFFKEIDDLTKRAREIPSLIEAARREIEKPDVQRSREGLFGRVSRAEAEDIASEATKITQKVARSRMSAIDRLNAEEADAIGVVRDKAATATDEKLAAYQKLEAAMRSFYKAEREEIQRNADEAIKAQQNVLKQANMDNTWRMVTGIEELGQKLDTIARQQRSQN